MFFSLRFQSQLKRTRPKLLHQLEKSIAETIENFGGEVKTEHKLIGASFDDTGIGFALDMLCILENMGKALEKASSELYGHICVLGRDMDEEDVPVLARGLPSDLWGTGIWCDPELRKLLEPFVDFDDPLSLPDYRKPFSGYAQVKKIRGSLVVPGDGESAWNDNSEKIDQYLKQSAWRNTAILGAEFIGKREGLYRYCTGNMGNFSPLVVRFGCGNAVTCIADAFTPDIKRLLVPDDAEKIAEMAELFFRERLREEVSEFLVKRGEKFFHALTEAYKAAAERAKVHPVVVLENLQVADSCALLIVSSVYRQRDDLYFYGTCTDMKALKPWEEIFPRIIKFSPEKKNRPLLPDIPPDLWEMAYACVLFGRFFPGYLISRLFAEEGKNPAMIEKTLALLSALHLTGGLSDPSPRFPNLVFRAEHILRDRAGRIRKIVRNRLMAWVDSGRIKPCFRLLEVLSALGGEGSDALMIEAVYGDVINGTCGDIEKAIRDGSLVSVAGESRAAPLAGIFKTQKALSCGDRDEIAKTFAEPFSINTLHSDFRARLLANQASYSLSVCDVDAAAALIKEAMLIAQEENAGRDLAHIYRLFSLVNFTNRQLSDAIDYFAFAAEDAEKTGAVAELALISYYSATVHFIFGNISKAERLARKAEEAALVASRPDWADRCRFFGGRLHFEAGRYQEALDIFRSLETDYYGSAPEGFAQTVAAWIYRSGVYLHNTVYRSGETTPEAGECYDGRLFQLEAAYLSGDYRKTLELAVDRNETLSRDRFLYIEQPDWRSGFAQCELLLFPLKDIWDRMFLTYRALALCHLADGEHGEKEEAIREMRRIMRDELPDTDPNDAFYFYSYYRILKRSGAPEVDMNTAISLAFKRLQRRASRIDDNQTKRSFLSLHYWNGALEAAAKEHKLI